MTTQKEIDNTLIATLESIIGVCEKTTSGNVSHNVATIKCKCRDMLQFYKKFPANQWHKIEEKQPPFMQIVILADSAQRFCLGYINTENKLRKCAKEKIDLEKITHWCEIPQFKEERKCKEK